MVLQDWAEMYYKMDNEGREYFFLDYTGPDEEPYCTDKKLVKL